MKTKMNLKQVAAIAVMIVAGTTGAFAQTYVTNGEPDTAALGSKARFKETLFIHANATMNDSRILWTWPAGYTAADVYEIDGVTPLPAADGNGTWGGADTEIVILTKAIASSLQLKAQERSYPKVGTGCIDPVGITKLIDVVAMPTVVSYGTDSTSCGNPIVALQVPVNVSGYGKFDIRLNVAAFNLGAVAIGAPQNVDLANQLNARTTILVASPKTVWMAVPLATLTAAAGGAFPATGCYFEVTTTDLQDRISKKNLAYNWGAHTGEVANANPDGANKYTFYIYPLPTTQPIQHIQNN